MAAPRHKIALDIDWHEARRISGFVGYQRGIELTAELKRVAQRECPVDTGYMRDHHFIKYLGAGLWIFVLYVDADYALFVHDGTRRNRANRWLSRSLDIVLVQGGNDATVGPVAA